MPICKRCRKMQATVEMRETPKEEKIDYERAGKKYPGLITHWVCLDKRRCKERMVSLKE